MDHHRDHAAARQWLLLMLAEGPRSGCVPPVAAPARSPSAAPAPPTDNSLPGRSKKFSKIHTNFYDIFKIQ